MRKMYRVRTSPLAIALVAVSLQLGSGMRASAGPLDTLTLEDLTATRELPLFTPVRHPPLPPPPPPPPPPKQVEAKPVKKPAKPPKPPKMRLVGVVMSGDTNVALMNIIGKGRGFKRLSQGDDHEGWKVVSVEPDTVKLKRGKQVRAYRMFRSQLRIPGAAAAAKARAAELGEGRTN